MNDQTVTDFAADKNRDSGDFRSDTSADSSKSPSGDSVLPMVIAATFTADSLQRPLQFWTDALKIPAKVSLAPYGQVMQELLDPESLFGRNRAGFNIVLIRLEDWIRDRRGSSVEKNLSHVRRAADDLVMAMSVMRTNTSAAMLAYLCPMSSTLSAEYRLPLEETQRDLISRISKIEHVHCFIHADVVQRYPIEQIEDLRSEQIAHIPYTNDYFIAVATILARRIAALIKPRHKVIAVDCDNTLWKGVCGEDGAAGVHFTEAQLEFQRMLVRQHDAGILLCLCTKNNPGDVETVFRTRPEMALKEEHLISSRVNWRSKSSNLESLANELELSLDSFIFVDDSPMECAEVRKHCPSVLVLKFPESPEEIAHFIEHVWAFDRVGATQEAQRRTALYRQNRARSEALEKATDLQKFLASLELQIDVAPMQPAQLERVAELAQRTNQFNLTTIRRRGSEIRALLDSGDLECLTVHVRDRFGDYGLVGVLLIRREPATLEVDTFLLSCRVLGRGVEHHIMNELGSLAQRAGVPSVVLKYRPTPRNAPAWEFLQKSLKQFESLPQAGDAAQEHIFRIPTEFAKSLGAAPSAERVSKNDNKAKPSGPAKEPSAANLEWHDFAYRLSRLPDIVREIIGPVPRAQVSNDDLSRAPREEAVAAIFAEVLGVEQVPIHANFFELGGDSLQAVRVITRIGSVLGLELALHRFIEAPSVEEVARNLSGTSQSGPAIVCADRSVAPVLSWAQERLWFIDQLEGGSAAYHIPLAIRVHGNFDRAVLQASLDAIVHRHESLHTLFVMANGQPVQQIAPSGQFALQSIDLRSLSGNEHDDEVLKQLREEILSPFDLRVGPLIRGRLLLLSEADQLLLVTMHHMISDGWSIGVFIKELGVVYEALRARQSDPLPALPVQYADYAQWQRQWLAGDVLDRQLSFWTEHLRGAPELLELPSDRPRPPVQTYRGASIPLSFTPEFTAELKAFSRHQNLTLAMTLNAAWSILLFKLSGQPDVVVGMPVANRPRTELEGLIGFFVNTLALRTRFDDDPSLPDLLQRVKQTMLNGYAHQDAPFEQVVRALQPTRSLAHTPIFQVMFVLHNEPREDLELAGLRWTEQEVPLQTAQFDLLLSLQEKDGAITGSLNYATDLFDKTTIERWTNCFESVLEAMLREPEQHISRLPLLNEAEKHKVLVELNATAASYAQDKLIHELFEEQVRRTPQAQAVLFEEHCLTYSQLNARANQLAHFLRARGVGPDALVGICLERSVEMLVGLLGILKAGGAYVPIDPNYPADRIEYMLENSAPRVLLIQEQLRARLPSVSSDVVAVDTEWDTITAYETSNPAYDAVGLCSRHLAYVIYTSGSTGRPKGAMNEHRALINRLQWMQSSYALSTADRVLQKTPFSFDVSVWEFFWTLTTGACLVVARPQGHHDPEYLRDVIERTGVTTLHFVPSMLQVFLDQHRMGRCESLRRIVCSGEELPAALQDKCLQLLPHVKLSNLYGPTEAAIDVTSWECRPEGRRVPIGRPIWNTQIYILDRLLQPVPIGVSGEIYIAGVGVARGYLNRPELTSERFVRDPFSTDPSARMYKTGDLGRWRSDGAIEYLGRNDHQVKIRGFRIELGEIESRLSEHEAVKEAIVIAREDVPGEKRLVGYVVVRESSVAAQIVGALRAHLKATLPEYMVPGALVMLDKLPLTLNGKLDRRALPAPQLEAFARRAYEPAQGEIEEILSGIWRILLRVERVGRRDNFFELGGHSLLIMQMMERLRRVGLATQVRSVYESATLVDLASVLTRDAVQQCEIPPNLIPFDCKAITPEMLPLVSLEAEHIERIVQSVPGGAANVQDIYPLAPLQEGILFHHLLNEKEGDTYVLPTVLSVSSQERLTALIAALQAAIDKHDILRTAVMWEHLPRPVQVVCRRAVLPVEELSLDPTRAPAEQIQQWAKPQRQRLDLRQAPLMRLQVAADANSGQWYALLLFHHIAIDHVTLETVTAETVAHLEGVAQRTFESVPYRNHVAQSLTYAKMYDAEAFFRSKLGDIDEPTAPFGLLDVHGDGTEVEEAREVVEPALAAQLRTHARRLGVSSATLFHAAWALVIAHTSGRDDVVFGSVLLGRLQGSAGAQQILGVFINTLPLRMRLDGLTAQQLVEQTQRELIELLGHEQASLAVAQRCSGIAGSAPLFNALLNYRHSTPNPEAQWSNAKGIEMLASQERTNYPIALSVDDLGEGFWLTAQTDRRIDPRRITAYMQVAVRSLIEALEKAPQTPALALRILPEVERAQILESFNATHLDVPRGTLVQLVQMQVERAAETTAVICNERELTYLQLNRRANQLAHVLVSRGVRPDHRVALFVERDLQLIIGLLAILKAGGAYVPLDVNYPAERIAHMLRDSASTVILTQSRLRSALPTSQTEVLLLDAMEDELAAMPETNLDASTLGLRARNVAYVIYTSGSTGTPKGVMVEHAAALNMIQWSRAELGFDAGRRSSSVASVGFDAAGWEIWPALCAGGTLYLASSEMVGDPEALVNWWAAQPLDVSFLNTPLAEFAFNRNIRNRQLHTLLVGGDRLRYRPKSEAFSLINNYGPTEAAVVATSGLVRDDDDIIDIGKPVSNARIYILNRHAQPAPIGVAGEIYIAGAGLARGYLSRPDLTADRFVPDPFSHDPSERMYRTGDVGRWRADGAIEYVGRNDHQIKIRGYRIELGEIEAQLAHHARVEDVAVVAREDVGGTRLVAYIVSDQSTNASGPVSAEELREYLKLMLPDYMVPSAFVMLEQLPLTPNGKVDRRALPAPEVGAYLSRQFEAPQGEVEEVLAGIWQGLLGVERVGRRDNFFELGGHSLLIVQMRERLRRLGLSVDVRTVFDSPTLADLASTLTPELQADVAVPPNLIPFRCEKITSEMLPLVQLDEQHIERIVSSVPGGAANIEDIYPLAPLQEGILFHHLFDAQGADTYVLATLFTIASRERVADFIGALQAVVDRYDVLRTAILWEHLPRPVQVVYRKATMRVVEATFDRDRDVSEQIKEWMKPQWQRLDLREAPLLRLQVAADPYTTQCYALLQFHHITSDHVTAEIVVSEVVGELDGRPQRSLEPIAYRNHVAQALQYARLHDAEAFFREKVGDVDEPTAPFGLTDVHRDGSHIEEVRVEFDQELSQLIRRQARSFGVSAATLFHAAWALVVAHTSGRDDVVFGSVLLGRLQGSAGAQRALGMFINTLPLRLRLHGVSVKELIERTQRELVELLGHEQASLAVAQRCSRIGGSAPLFTALLNYRHSVSNVETLWAAEGVQLRTAQERTNYPITLSVDDFGDQFALNSQTDSRIDPQKLIDYLHTALVSMAQALELAPNTAALELSILPDRERQQLMDLFNATRAAFPKDKLVHQLVEAQVAQTPLAIAVEHGGQCLTYAELEVRANRLASHLRDKGVCANRLVGVCIERSVDMVVALLAILKAGCAYLPLDPNYPAERLQHMLTDAAPQVVLTHESVRSALPATQAEIIELNDSLTKSGDETNEDAASTQESSSLVYVIYTSGSTGRPKGTAMEHRSMVNLIEWHREALGARAGQRVLQFAALSFDVAFQEIFSTLCTGGTLVMLDEWVRRDARELLRLLDNRSIERLFVPPLVLQSMAEHFEAVGSRPKSLQDIITAGEQLRISPEIVAFFKYHERCRLHNHYGPTETHVVSALTLAGGPEKWPLLPSIGRPIANAQLHILNERLQHVPTGVAGEIYIGGAGVARGYLRRPELTEQRFIDDPFSPEPHARLYKTGDLGRWFPDGTIEYLGRNDDQVKIRGYRIELGEIEAQLSLHPNVKEVAVVAREDEPGERRLVAYVAPRDADDHIAQNLRAYLKERLPEHMVPGAFVVMESLPLTPTGKLNRRALPVPELGAYATQHYDPPQGEIEETLANIWQQVLGAARVGRGDNFFELGGHSLLVLKALLKINEALDATMRVTDVYKSPTIRELATRIAGSAVVDELVNLAREAALEPDILPVPGRALSPARNVLLTGATGFVGRFLLVQLLEETDATIHCLVRVPSTEKASSRLRSMLLKWDLWRDEFAERIVAIPGDLRLPRLGVIEETWDQLCKCIDAIYHCATSMNHLETYAMAKPANVGSTKELLRLATRYQPKAINYISTLGVFGSAASDVARIVNEDSPIDHEKHSASSGYLASKWVSEKMFMIAVERGIPCNIFRLGLVWGDTQRGRFDELQSVYRVLKTCLLSGFGIADYRYPMPPTPVDYVARSIVALARRHPEGQRVYHLSAPGQSVDDVFERCGEIAGISLDLLPYYEWICEIKRLYQAGYSLPAVPIIDYAFSMDEVTFYRHLRNIRSAENVVFECANTRRELEQQGLVARAFDEALLRPSVEDMLARDPELREVTDRARWVRYASAGRGRRHT